MKISGYTLHGDYYLANKIIPNKNWKEACKTKEKVTLPNGKTVVAHTLSKAELKTIPLEERGIDSKWYWTSTPYYGSFVWAVDSDGGFYSHFILGSIDGGGARLGFHKNEIKQFLDVE